MVNTSMTHYHHSTDPITRLSKWTRYNYENVMWIGGKGSSTNKGYENANDVSIRIWYLLNDISISNFAIGDIIVKGTLSTDITKQADIVSNDIYNITAFKDNNFSEPKSQHIHVSGK